MRRSAAVLLALSAGCGRADFTAITATRAGAHEASLAPFGDGLVAAWYDTRDGHPEIYLRRLDADGRPAGPELRLTTTNGAAYEADVQPLGSTLIVGWYDKAPDGALVPRLGAWTASGASLWTKALSSKGRNTVVRTGAGAIFAAWIEDETAERAGLWAGWWRGDGSELIAPRRLADAGRTTWTLNAAIDPAASPGRPRAWVAFDAKAGTQAEELFVVDIGEKETRVVQLTPDDGFASKYPDVALAGDRAAVTWFDVKDGNEEVYLAAGGRDLFDGSGRLHARRVTMTPGHSIGAYLAWNGDRLGLAWCDDSDGGQHDVFVQAFAPVGEPAGPPMRVTQTPVSSLIPAIEPWKSGFALAWNEYEGASAASHGGDSRSQIAFRVIQ